MESRDFNLEARDFTLEARNFTLEARNYTLNTRNYTVEARDSDLDKRTAPKNAPKKKQFSVAVKTGVSVTAKSSIVKRMASLALRVRELTFPPPGSWNPVHPHEFDHAGQGLTKDAKRSGSSVLVSSPKVAILAALVVAMLAI